MNELVLQRPHESSPAIRYLLCAYTVLIPLFVVRITDDIAIGAVDILAPISAIILIASRKRSSMQIDEALAWMFLIWSLVSAVFAIAIGTFNVRSALVMRLVFIFMPFMLTMMAVDFSCRDLERLLNIFIWSGGASICIGIVLYSMGVSTSTTIQQNWYGGAAPTARAGGLAGNSGDFGHLAAAWTIICISFGLYFKKTQFAIMSILAIGLYASYISSSRAAILHIAIGIIMIAPIIFYKRKILNITIAAMIGLVAFILILNWAATDPNAFYVIKRFDIINASGESTFYQTGRFGNWQMFLDHSLDNLFFGVGFKNIMPVVGAPGDNAFLTILVESGLIAALCYLLFWVILVIKSFLVRDRILRIAMVAIILSEIAHMTTVDTYTMWSTSPFILMFIAAGLRVGASAARS